MKASDYRSLELVEIDSATDGHTISNINNANNNGENNDEAQLLLQNQQQLPSLPSLPSLSKFQWLTIAILTILNTLLVATFIMHPWKQQRKDSRIVVVRDYYFSALNYII